jgi:hypothetical protein
MFHGDVAKWLVDGKAINPARVCKTLRSLAATITGSNPV